MTVSERRTVTAHGIFNTNKKPVNIEEQASESGAHNNQDEIEPSNKVISIGEFVFFGCYEQDGNEENGSEAIAWKVLDIQDGKALILSKYVIETAPYHDQQGDVNWENSSLNSWLNHSFIGAAFTDEEKMSIQNGEVSLLNEEDLTTYGTLLSDLVQCKPTAYAYSKGIDTDSERNCYWWLQDGGQHGDGVVNIYPDGSVDSYGYYASYPFYGVRPVIWVDVAVLTNNEADSSSELLYDAEMASEKRSEVGALSFLSSPVFANGTCKAYEDPSTSSKVCMSYTHTQRAEIIPAYIYGMDGTRFLRSVEGYYLKADEYALLSRENPQEVNVDFAWEHAEQIATCEDPALLYRATSNRKNVVIGIDPGHGTTSQKGKYFYCHPDHSLKTTGGSTAKGSETVVASGVGMSFKDGAGEGPVNLETCLILKERLLDAGYDVLMLREKQPQNLDLLARTLIANHYADCHVSIHYDGDGLSYDKGVFVINVPDGIKDMYPVSEIWEEDDRLGYCIRDSFALGDIKIDGDGVHKVDLLQTSYSSVPSTVLELGNEWTKHTPEYEGKVSNAIVIGTDLYFFGEVNSGIDKDYLSGWIYEDAQ